LLLHDVITNAESARKRGAMCFIRFLCCCIGMQEGKA
jgi:hypothetical protein